MTIYIISILIFLIVAPYIIYPAVMLALAYILPGAKQENSGEMPYVTIIIPTYNEEKVIAERFKNLEALSYPRNKLQVIIIDSGSKDKTAELAGELAKSSRLDFLVLKQEERKGKANAVNYAVQHSKGEIIIVSDANALFEKDGIEEVVKPFGNAEVGGAGGRFITLGTNTVGKGEELYWSIEDYIRRTESRIYSLTNFSGEFNAFRKCLGLVLDERALSEDLDLTIQIIKMGYKVIYVPSARVYEPSVENTKDLIKQKKRRAVGALQVVFKHIDIIAKPKLWAFNVLLFFHRILRLFTPILTLILLTALCYLFFASDYENKYDALGFTAAVVVTVFLITGIVFKKSLIQNLYYFLVLQYSYVLAWIEFFTGKYKVTWEKTESSRDLKNVIGRIK